jgi:hypothetical protein
VQRGNNRRVCFLSDADMKADANRLYEGAGKFGVDIPLFTLTLIMFNTPRWLSILI